MDLASITAGYNGLRFIKNAMDLALKTHIDNETRQRISEALDKVGELQDGLFNAQQELLRLQDENRKLSTELAEKEEWNDRAAQYSLTTAPGGAVVYKSRDDEPTHYACPACFEKRCIGVLQTKKVVSGAYRCPQCRAEYFIDERKPETITSTGPRIGFDEPLDY